uniref:uncharacterized protein LOC120337851 n=1 Tax=Styela clava TaxID=7725 RepID=UPI00193A02E9|nr:uncharacterized protein LOC120337851 [Styela clava]
MPLSSIDEHVPFVVECDASEIAISATLNQGGRPVAFWSRVLQKSERFYPAVEKEATAIIEAVRKWAHFLARRPFTIVTDQRSVSFMLDNRRRSKIKNNKIQSWRLELASFSYDVRYRPGKQNAAPDALTRSTCASVFPTSLQEIHEGLCHPGVTRLLHFVKSKNLPFSTDDVKRTCKLCRVCAELKPKFYSPPYGTLIKATRPFERLSMDFKGPLPSRTKNVYMLTIVDEYSRFPFVFPCTNLSSAPVISCLEKLFALCGIPGYIHSDRGKSFMSAELRDFLLKRGVATSQSSPYHPIGNSQVERFNGIIWKAVRLCLRTYNLPITHWEYVLPKALQSLRSLLCTAVNATPHELFFNFQHRSPSGHSLPTWLCESKHAFLRKFVRSHKNDDLVEQVELKNVNPAYARVRFSDGRESTVSLRDLSPCPVSQRSSSHDRESQDFSPEDSETSTNASPLNDGCNVDRNEEFKIEIPISSDNANNERIATRRSTRTNIGVPPERYGFEI